MIVFRQLDINNDGELNEDEFVAGCMKDTSLLELLNNAQWTSLTRAKKYDSPPAANPILW